MSDVIDIENSYYTILNAKHADAQFSALMFEGDPSLANICPDKTIELVETYIDQVAKGAAAMLVGAKGPFNLLASPVKYPLPTSLPPTELSAQNLSLLGLEGPIKGALGQFINATEMKSDLLANMAPNLITGYVVYKKKYVELEHGLYALVDGFIDEPDGHSFGDPEPEMKDGDPPPGAPTSDLVATGQALHSTGSLVEWSPRPDDTASRLGDELAPYFVAPESSPPYQPVGLPSLDRSDHLHQLPYPPEQHPYWPDSSPCLPHQSPNSRLPEKDPTQFLTDQLPSPYPPEEFEFGNWAADDPSSCLSGRDLRTPEASDWSYQLPIAPPPDEVTELDPLANFFLDTASGIGNPALEVVGRPEELLPPMDEDMEVEELLSDCLVDSGMETGVLPSDFVQELSSGHLDVPPDPGMEVDAPDLEVETPDRLADPDKSDNATGKHERSSNGVPKWWERLDGFKITANMNAQRQLFVNIEQVIITVYKTLMAVEMINILFGPDWPEHDIYLDDWIPRFLIGKKCDVLDDEFKAVVGVNITNVCYDKRSDGVNTYLEVLVEGTDLKSGRMCYGINIHRLKIQPNQRVGEWPQPPKFDLDDEERGRLLRAHVAELDIANNPLLGKFGFAYVGNQH